MAAALVCYKYAGKLEGQTFYLSERRLALEGGMSKNTARAALAGIIEAGWVCVVPREDRSGTVSTTYRLAIPARLAPQPVRRKRSASASTSEAQRLHLAPQSEPLAPQSDLSSASTTEANNPIHNRNNPSPFPLTSSQQLVAELTGWGVGDPRLNEVERWLAANRVRRPAAYIRSTHENGNLEDALALWCDPGRDDDEPPPPVELEARRRQRTAELLGRIEAECGDPATAQQLIEKEAEHSKGSASDPWVLRNVLTNLMNPRD